MIVRDLMTTPVVVAHPETPLKEIAGLLVEHRIGGIPIVDADDRVLGVVSEADFLVKETGRPPKRRSRPLAWLLAGARADEIALRRIQAETAGEAMTSPACTIEPTARLAEAARRMTERRVNRLPVVAEERLVGIITRADLVRAFARSDAELRAAAAHAVRAVDGMSVLRVEDGVVTVNGTVSHPAVAEGAVRMIADIEGVVAVDDRDLTSIDPEVLARETELEGPPAYVGWRPDRLGPGSGTSEG